MGGVPQVAVQFVSPVDHPAGLPEVAAEQLDLRPLGPWHSPMGPNLRRPAEGTVGFGRLLGVDEGIPHVHPQFRIPWIATQAALAQLSGLFVFALVKEPFHVFYQLVAIKQSPLPAALLDIEWSHYKRLGSAVQPFTKKTF